MINSFLPIQEQVFTFEQADLFKEELRKLEPDCFFLERTTERRGLIKQQPAAYRYANPNDSWFPVQFDSSGQVQSEEVTSQYKKDISFHQTLQKLSRIALNWFGAKMKWQAQERWMALSIMQHAEVKKGKTVPEIQWHADYSDHTLVILMDNESNWEGGTFLYRETNTPDKVTNYIPKKGCGLLFTNECSQHSVEAWTAKSECVDRTIITFHEKRHELINQYIIKE